MRFWTSRICYRECWKDVSCEQQRPSGGSTRTCVVTPSCKCPAESWKESRWKTCLRNGLFLYLISFTNIWMFRARNCCSPQKYPKGLNHLLSNTPEVSLQVQGWVCLHGPSRTHPGMSSRWPQTQRIWNGMIQLGSELIFLGKWSKFLVSHRQLAPPSPCRSRVLPFVHGQWDWETANLLSFCPPEHQRSLPEWFLLIAMMKSWIVLAFYARLTHTFLEEYLKRGEKEGFPPRSETQDRTGRPVVPHPEKVQDFSP